VASAWPARRVQRASLEWATTCPPPLRNFDRIPRIRSEPRAFDAKYGHNVADLGRDIRAGDVPAPQSLATR
jgi:cytochrome c oxidase subunit 1